MTALHRLLILVGLLFVLAPRTAQATVSQEFCFKYGTAGFTDLATPTGGFLTGNEVSNGATFRIIRNSNGDVFDFVLGSDGCKTINLNAEAWRVKILRKASLNGNSIEVRDDVSGALHAQTVETAWTPNGVKRTWTTSSAAGRIMAAATVALARHNGGLLGVEYSFRNGLSNCDPGAFGCFDAATETIHIGTGSSSTLDHYKFGIVHEMGHAMAYYADHSNPNNKDYGADAGGPCAGSSSHSMESKEFQSAAAVEGMAHFYSALSFNDDTVTACEIEKHYAPDWNQDGDPDVGEDSIFDCEVGTTAPNPDVPDLDYLGTYNSATCLSDGKVDNRGTEYDWLRALWDFRTDFGVPFFTILDIWDGADPHNWNKNGNGSGGDYPATRVRLGALNVGGQSLYDDWTDNATDNGINR